MTSEKPEVIAALLKIKRKADYTDEELLVITINNLIKMGLLEIDRSRGAIRLTKNGREKLEKWLYGKKRVLDKHELAVLYGLHTAKEAYLDEPDFILGLCRLPEDGDKGFVDLLIEDLLENRLIAKVKVRRGRLLGVRYTLTEKGGKVVAKHEKEMLNARKLFENAVSTEEQEKIIKKYGVWAPVYLTHLSDLLLTMWIWGLTGLPVYYEYEEEEEAYGEEWEGWNGEEGEEWF